MMYTEIVKVYKRIMFTQVSRGYKLKALFPSISFLGVEWYRPHEDVLNLEDISSIDLMKMVCVKRYEGVSQMLKRGNRLMPPLESRVNSW